jgi:hypothetical protein
MSNDSVVGNPSQVWGGKTSVFSQIGDFISAPFQAAPTANLTAPPPPPTPGMATQASLNTQVQSEAQQFGASTQLTGGTGVTQKPMTASATLLGR